MKKFTLQLYKNPLLSRRAVDNVIVEFDNFVSELFIPHLQNEMKNHLTNEETYDKVQFFLRK